MYRNIKRNDHLNGTFYLKTVNNPGQDDVHDIKNVDAGNNQISIFICLTFAEHFKTKSKDTKSS